MATKLASEIEVGDVLVHRPQGETLYSPDTRPTIYRKVLKVEVETRRRDGSQFVVVFGRPPRSMGRYDYFEADDEVEITTEVTESCSIAPNGLVLR